MQWSEGRPGFGAALRINFQRRAKMWGASAAFPSDGPRITTVAMQLHGALSVGASPVPARQKSTAMAKSLLWRMRFCMFRFPSSSQALATGIVRVPPEPLHQRRFGREITCSTSAIVILKLPKDVDNGSNHDYLPPHCRRVLPFRILSRAIGEHDPGCGRDPLNEHRQGETWRLSTFSLRGVGGGRLNGNGIGTRDPECRRYSN